jgi:N-acyl-D-aspartate/D-glutamate deacylase
MHDLVIRDAKIVGGSGAPAVYGDVAVDDGIVLQVDGAKAATGKREINAHGTFLAPGWVDVHTHYDGQATWDPYLSPSSWHGVTMAVMGNLRPYMMGLNGIESNDANAQEIEEMRRLTREALVAGALGFSTSRTLIHKGADGKHVPGTFA